MFLSPDEAPVLGGPAPRGPSLLERALRVLGAGVGGGLFVTVVGLLGHQVATGEHWQVDRVTVAGNLHASEVAVRHLADVPAGAHLLTIDLNEVAASVERHPWVSRVEVSRSLPGTIEIVVEEHETVMLLALDRLWAVDDRGVPFKQARGERLDYPILTGLDTPLTERRPDLADAVVQGALRILDTGEGHPVVGRTAVSELHFDDRLGFVVVTRNGSEFIVGFDHPQGALDRLDTLLAAGLDLSRPHRVDLDAGSVAIATPLPSARELTARP